jgi:MFS family permease
MGHSDTRPENQLVVSVPFGRPGRFRPVFATSVLPAVGTHPDAVEALVDTVDRNTRWVRPLCWTAVMLDGFDMVVLGVVLPVLLSDHVWGLTAATGSLVSTAGLAGMTIGALVIGTVTDVIGRRRALMLSVAIFLIFTLLCALAPSAEIFGALRFLAGIGLGDCLPTAITRVTEHQAARGRGACARRSPSSSAPPPT